MNATEQIVSSDLGVVAIRSVQLTGPYKLLLVFSDGKENEVDFEPFLRNSRHPAIRSYLDPERFKTYALEDGVLQWNDFDLVFPMADLYAGQIR